MYMFKKLFNIPVSMDDIDVNLYFTESFYKRGNQCIVCPHNHSDYEMYIIESGHGKVMINHETFEVSKGDILLIHPLEYHVILKENICEDLKKYDILFSLAEPDGSNTKKKRIYQQLLGILNYQRILHLKTDRMLGFCSFLQAELLEGKVESGCYIRSLCALIFLEMLRCLSPEVENVLSGKVTNTLDLHLMVDSYFGKNYLSDVKIQDFADYFHVSMRQANNILNDLYGMSFTQKLIRMRLEQAVVKLIYTNSSITDICYDCGFHGQSFFNSSFLKTYGVTPSQFRKNNRMAEKEQTEKTEEPDNRILAECFKDLK